MRFVSLMIIAVTFYACKPKKNTGNTEVTDELKPISSEGDATSIKWGSVTMNPQGDLIETLYIDLIRPGIRPGAADSTLCYKALDKEYILGSAQCTKGNNERVTVTAANVNQRCSGSLSFADIPASEKLSIPGCSDAELIHFKYEPTVVFSVEQAGLTEFKPNFKVDDQHLPQVVP